MLWPFYHRHEPVNNNIYLLTAASLLILLSLARCVSSNFAPKDLVISALVSFSALAEIFLGHILKTALNPTGPLGSVITNLPGWLFQPLFSLFYSTPLLLLLFAIWLGHAPPDTDTSDE